MGRHRGFDPSSMPHEACLMHDLIVVTIGEGYHLRYSPVPYLSRGVL